MISSVAFVNAEESVALFMPQRNHRVYLCRAASGHQTSYQSHSC